MLKINLCFDYDLSEIAHFGHRDGWKGVVSKIYGINNLQATRKILLVDFMEKTFIWDNKGANMDWVGILHNTPYIPPWYDQKYTPKYLLGMPSFKGSLGKCKGIIVLSRYFANWLRPLIPISIPISVLNHPTEDPNIKFSMERFLNNGSKLLVQIGFWLKKLCMIGLVKTNVYRKLWLSPPFDWMDQFVDCERRGFAKDPTLSKLEYPNMKDIERIYVDNEQYDQILSENICIIYLYDSSASNTVIECIARNTPLLVNKLPAVVEYIGEEYPLYYETVEEAESKMHDFKLIGEAHEYLKNSAAIHERISYSKFVDDFINCDAIKNIGTDDDST
jgi:hypothetical protein